MSIPPGEGIWLIAAAAPREVDAVLRAFDQPVNSLPIWERVGIHDWFDVVRTGVGKANAAGGVSRVIDPDRHAGVLSVGLAGVLPGSSLSIGDSVCATRSVFSDEGVGTPDGFVPMDDLGFGYFDDGSMGIAHDPSVLGWLDPLCDESVPVACVSWCSGDDGCARGVVDRTHAHAEAMEGAACALCAQRYGVLSGELRVISNTTGNRETQRWDLDGALDALSAVLGLLQDL